MLDLYYKKSQKKESSFLHTYVLNEFSTVDHSCTVQQNILEKTLIEVDRSHFYASFGTFCVQIGQLFESLQDFKLSEKFEIDLVFLQKQRFYRFQTFFKDSLNLQKLTNLNVKGA